MGTADGLRLRGKTYWSDFYFNGQRVRTSLRTRDLRTALERFKYLKAGFQEGAAPAPQTVTAGEDPAHGDDSRTGTGAKKPSTGFSAIAAGYLSDLRLRTDKRNSIRCAEYQVATLLRIESALKRRHLRRDDLRMFVATRLEEGVSAATINQGLSVFKSVIRFGVREGKLEDPRIDFGSLARKKMARDRYLPRKQIEKLLETAKYTDARVYPLIYLAYHSGARLGELLQLRWGWIDLDTGRVQIRNTADWSSKTREGRVFYIPDDALEWLRDYHATLHHGSDEAPVLQMRPGRPWTEHVHKVLRKVFKVAGIDSRIGVHGLRHSSVTDMLESGIPVHIVQQHHGHKDSTTTLRHYAHAREGALREAAAAMALRRTRSNAKVG